MIKGDKIKLVNKMGVFTNVGETCEVVDVAKGGVISFRFGNNRQHLGCMSYDEFEKYFELVPKVENKKKRAWSEWEHIVIGFCNLNKKYEDKFAMIRNNVKKVQVRLGALRSESTCHKDDKFCYATGKDIAIKRLILKILKNNLDAYVKTL